MNYVTHSTVAAETLMSNEKKTSQLRKKLQGKGYINGPFYHSNPPRVLSMQPSEIRRWIRAGDLEKLENVVLAGQGHKLLAEFSTDQNIQRFLKTVPAYMARLDMLHESVEKGKLRDVQLLLKEEEGEELLNGRMGRLVLSKDRSGFGLLHKAVKIGNIEMVEWLLGNYPLTISVRDKDRRVPLHFCGVSKDPEETWRLLVEAGADATVLDIYGKTPTFYMHRPDQFHLQVSRNQPRASKLQVKSNMSQQIRPANIRIWIHDQDLGKLKRVLWEGQGDKLRTETSANPVVRKFLAGVPYVMGTIKDTHCATVQNDLQQLKKKTAHPVPEEIFLCCDSNGLNPLHKAAGLGFTEIVRYIIEKCPEAATRQDNEGRTPLHYAAIQKDGQQIFNILKSAGAEEKLVDKNGRTANYYRLRPNELDMRVLEAVPSAPRNSNVYPTGWSWSLLEDTEDSTPIISRSKKNHQASSKLEDGNSFDENSNKNSPSENNDNLVPEKIIQNGLPNGRINKVKEGHLNNLPKSQFLEDTNKRKELFGPFARDKSLELQALEDPERMNRINKKKRSNFRRNVKSTQHYGSVFTTPRSKESTDGEDKMASTGAEKFSQNYVDTEEDNSKDSFGSNDRANRGGNDLILDLHRKILGSLSSSKRKSGEDGDISGTENHLSLKDEIKLNFEGETRIDDAPRRDSAKNSSPGRSKNGEKSSFGESNHAQGTQENLYTLSDSQNNDQEERENSVELKSNSIYGENWKTEEENRKTEGLNRKTEKVNQQTEGENRKTEEENRKTEKANRKTKEGNQETEDENQKTEKANRKTEEVNQETEDENQKTEKANRKTEEENRKTEEENRKTEEENRKTEEENRKTEGENRKTEGEYSGTEEENQETEDENQKTEEENQKMEEENRETEEENRKAEGESAEYTSSSGQEKCPVKSASKRKRVLTDSNNEEEGRGDTEKEAEKEHKQEDRKSEASNGGSNLIDIVDEEIRENQAFTNYVFESQLKRSKEENTAKEESASMKENELKLSESSVIVVAPVSIVRPPPMSENIVREFDNGVEKTSVEADAMEVEKTRVNKDQAKKLVEEGDIEKLADVVLEGDGATLIGFTSEDSRVQAFLNAVPSYLSKIERIHEACTTGDLRELQIALDRRKFAVARDSESYFKPTPLHVATLFERTPVVQYLASRFPESLHVRDTKGRTALHYAATLPSELIYNLLTSLGADSTLPDEEGYNPKQYLKNRHLLHHSHLMEIYKRKNAMQNKDSNSVTKKPPTPYPQIGNLQIFGPEDGRYLSQTVGGPLIKGLTEVANTRPDNPVKYLGNFLVNFKESPGSSGKVSNEKLEIGSSPVKPAIKGSPEQTRESNRKFSSQDVATPPISALELTESKFDAIDRDEFGQTMIHMAAARSHSRNAFYELLVKLNSNLSFRDELYRTARDVAVLAGRSENAVAIDRYILHLVALGETEKLHEMLLDGYDHLLDLETDEAPLKVAIDRGHEHLIKLFNYVDPFQKKRDILHAAIRVSDENRVEEIVKENPGIINELAIGKNFQGRTSLHVALLAQAEDIIKFLVERFPQTLKIGDNLLRTPLHYAMGLNKVEMITNILIQAGAERVIKDLKGRQPSYYFMNKSDILELQSEEKELIRFTDS